MAQQRQNKRAAKKSNSVSPRRRRDKHATLKASKSAPAALQQQQQQPHQSSSLTSAGSGGNARSSAESAQAASQLEQKQQPQRRRSSSSSSGGVGSSDGAASTAAAALQQRNHASRAAAANNGKEAKRHTTQPQAQPQQQHSEPQKPQQQQQQQRADDQKPDAPRVSSSISQTPAIAPYKSSPFLSSLSSKPNHQHHAKPTSPVDAHKQQPKPFATQQPTSENNNQQQLHQQHHSPLAATNVTSSKTANMAHQIKSIKARQIYDSRGNPTVEVDLHNGDGVLFRSAVPSGASTGIHEALELRDNDKTNWLGKGVTKAVKHVNETLGPALIAKNIDVVNQQEIDKFMIDLDGTENKSKFGANAILGISLAACKAGAHAKNVPLYHHIADLAGVKEFVLPVPAFNVINGGSHAGNALAMQEFMILPTGASSFSEALKIGAEVYQHLKAVIKEQYGLEATCVGDEGGFAPNISNNKQGLELIKTAIERAKYTGKVEIGMDVAASEFYKDGKYDLLWKTKESSPDKYLTGDQLGDVYRSFAKEFPIVSIEDPFDQDDWDSWNKLTSSVQFQIVGDDLTVTNPKRIKTAVEKKSCNCLLLKVNQIGTVTESIEAHNLAKANNWGTMISHRSGETEDTFIADLTVGLSTGQIKTGAPARSERLAKYNQILRIEEELGSKAKFAGKNFRHPLKKAA